MARTRCGRQTKASQNSSRVGRAAARRSSCSSRNCRITARVQSWRCVAQNEIGDSVRPCVPITVNANSIRVRSGKRILQKSRTRVLFGLKWHDIDFHRNEISVTRSIVFQVVGPCKTEASQKPVPLDSRPGGSLKVWRDHTKYSQAEDWVLASPAARGRRPYWGQSLMRTIIRPAAAKVGIGWHTSRHTYSSLLRANKTDIKVTQELLRHASSRVTLDTYTQAVTVQKRRAQSSVIRLLHASNTGWLRLVCLGRVPNLCPAKRHARRENTAFQ
jgi:hypothetical protein